MQIATDIQNQLRAGVNFAGIEYNTDVATAAAHRHHSVRKHTRANVQLFANIQDARRVFEAAVKRSAERIGSTDATHFAAQENYYEHTDTYSIVRHRTTGRLYLYAIFNSAQSEYTIDGVTATREEVAALLTPSAARAMLEPSATTVNKTHGVEHDVVVRTIALDNIVSVRANHATVTH